jgi:hypothetical protein
MAQAKLISIATEGEVRLAGVWLDPLRLIGNRA